MNLRFNLFGKLKDLKKTLIRKGLSRESDFDRYTLKKTRGNAHFFIEDISQHKMPYSRRLGNYPNFNVTIEGTEIEKAKLMLNNLSQHSHNHSDTDLVSDIINNLSKKMYYWGEIYYCKNNVIHGPACLEIWPLGLFRIFNFYIQIIPRSKKFKSSTFLRYEKAMNVFRFSLFKSQFQKLKFFLIKRMLNRDRTGFPSFFVADKFQNGNFDLKYYKRIEAVFMALITKGYAWKLRYLADDYKNEFFRFYSSYLSAIRDAEDREAILSQINQMLKHFEIDATLNLEGIPTSHYLKGSLQELSEGRKTFSEALKDIYLT